jgi:hypothetical protein
LYLFNTQVQTPIKLYEVAYALTYGLEQIVLNCITARGDFPLSDTGLRVASGDVGVVIQNRPHSVVPMTHSSTASVLRGLWEVMYLYGPKTALANIYVGGQLDSNHLGTLVVYKKVGNASAVGVA